jgi:hypothetical protein
MDIAFVPYAPEHLAGLALRPGQAALRAFIAQPEYCRALAVDGLSFTALDGSGRVLGCGGVLPELPHRATAWLLAADTIPARAWARVTVQVREVLDAAGARGIRRVQAFVHERFGSGLIWMRHLGFTAESVADAFNDDGSAAVVFVRIAGRDGGRAP